MDYYTPNSTLGFPIPFSISFEVANLGLPPFLRPVIIGELRIAFNHCRHAAARAYRLMKGLHRRRECRFKAMCPLNPPARFHAHCISVERLMNWREDYFPIDPHFAPTPKIPTSSLAFHIDEDAYETWASEYNRLLEEYIQGPYQNWLDAKENVEIMLSKAELGSMNWHMWQGFWNRQFLAEMDKWEVHVNELELPSFCAISEELYNAIVERVEDGGRLAHCFRRDDTTISSLA